jgi:hypothetical protein
VDSHIYSRAEVMPLLLPLPLPLVISYNNNDDTSSSSDHSTVGNYYCEDNHDDANSANDDADDINDAHDCFSYFASSDDSSSSYPSSICDGVHGEEDYKNNDDNNYTFAYASCTPHAASGNNCNALGGTSNAINDCNNHNAVGSSDDDIMSLSFTNQSLQQNVFASDSSSLLAPVTIQNVMPAQTSTGMTLGRIHQMVKTSGPVPKKVY